MLTGGRLTAEDAFAYSTFARVALGTHDIDFRARPPLGRGSGVPRLRGRAALRRQRERDVRRPRVRQLRPPRRARARGRGRHDLPAAPPGATASTAPGSGRWRRSPPNGLRKMGGTLIAARPGSEAERRRRPRPHDGGVELDSAGVILVGERMAAVPGCPHRGRRGWPAPAARSWPGCRVVPATAVRSRPAACRTCCPVVARLSDAGARVDAATAWGLDSLPEHEGRDGDAIVAALASGELGGLVVGGVDPDDTFRPAAFRAALEAASFVVALELRDTDVTRCRRRGLPGRGGRRQGRHVRELGGPDPRASTPCSPTRTLPARRRGSWPASPRSSGRPLGVPHHGRGPPRDDRDGSVGRRARRPARCSLRRPPTSDDGALALATWKLMLDGGSMQDGEKYLRATARTPVCRVSPGRTPRWARWSR